MPGTEIVIVDDDPVLRQVVRRLLEGHGHHIAAEVDSAQGAISVASLLDSPVVVLDWSMPGGSGEETAARLTSEAPTAAVIVLSAFDGDPEVVERLGLAAWLPKTRLAELPGVVAEVTGPPEATGAAD